MFSGEYNHTLDDKYRLTIPSKFRDTLAAGLVISRGIDKHLSIRTIPEWEKFSERVLSLNKGNTQNRKMIRRLIGGHVNIKPDKQGRILLPEHLRRFAEVDREAVVVGMNNELEVWSPDRWQEMLASVESDDLAEGLEEFVL